MIIVMKAGGITIQLMNFFFLASGLFNDLLIIRICLTIAYLFLLISGLFGLPVWGESLSGGTGRIAPDVIVWSIVNIVVIHGSGVIRMYWDERKIKFEKEEQEMLWRFFYRHSGLSKAQFLDLIIPHLQLKTYRLGDPIPSTTNFNIVLDGSIMCDVTHVDHRDGQQVMLASGDMFPLIHIYKYFMPQKSFFHRSAIQNAVVGSATARVFSIPIHKLEEMAFQPNAKVAWTAMLIASLSEIAEREFNANQNTPDESRQKSVRRISVSRHAGHTHPLFGALLPHEEPDPLQAGSGKGLVLPVRHALRYVWLSIYLPWPFGNWPVGLRHCLPAPHGDDSFDYGNSNNDLKVTRSSDSEGSDGSSISVFDNPHKPSEMDEV